MADSSVGEARDGSSDGRRRSVEEVKKEAVFFKMSRNSKTASRLKALISEKLHNFIGYSDEVLSDYIVVLVCNGKNMYQAREELEDFLRERTEEFVAWLWELLLEDFSAEKEDCIAFDPNGAVNSNSSGADNCSKVDKSRDLKHNSAYSQRSFLAQVENTCEPSETPSINAPAENESKNVLRKAGSTELGNCKRIRSAIVGAKGKQIIGDCTETRKPYVHHDSTERQHQIINLPDRLPDLWNPQSVPSGHAGEVSLQKAKPRVSVWDRLGKGCNDASVGVPNSLMPYIHVPRKEMEMLHQHFPSIPVPNTDLSREEGNEVSTDGNRCYSVKSHLPRVTESANIVDIYPRINVKRHFNEISTYPEKDMLDVKQKLQHIELQLSQLRPKQMEREKDEKLVCSSKSCELEHQKEDVDARTVYVANVHFAATKEAISLYFTNCGVVENVRILTGQDTQKPKGAAFVTFTDKESADKALSLDGAVFYSRPVKVTPKEKAAIGTTTAASGIRRAARAQFPGKPALRRPSMTAFMGRRNFSSPHLQWRRGSSTAFAQSKPLAPAGTQETEALPTTAIQKQPSSSTTD